jgi:hypothetical protein
VADGRRPGPEGGAETVDVGPLLGDLLGEAGRRGAGLLAGELRACDETVEAVDGGGELGPEGGRGEPGDGGGGG